MKLQSNFRQIPIIGGMKVLIIEDEKRIAESLKKGLEISKCVVDVAYDGEEGYDLALGEEYDLIILDLMLPNMSGLDICRSLREKQISTPILILTARDQTQNKIEGLNAGADDYLTKPFSFEELLARVKAITRRSKKITKNTLVVRDLTLDTVIYEVKRQKRTIKLSSKEFAILTYFMQHPNQILTKDQLIQNVWNYNSDILPNTVEVFIKKLRQKIDKPFRGKPIISTVRGFGYKVS